MARWEGRWTQDAALVGELRRRHAAGHAQPALLRFVREQGYAAPADVTAFAAALRRLGMTRAPGFRGVDPGGASPPDQADTDDEQFLSNKKRGSLNWREATHVLQQMQALKQRASSSQDYATIDFGHITEPIAVMALSDAHFGSFCTDYNTLVQVTDEILAIPNLYIACLGDFLQMSIRLRSVLEVADNILTPQLQLQYLESWLAEIAHKVLFATWDNHSSERMEKQAGVDMYGEIFKRRVVFHSGIGHTDVLVGDQTYTFAVSHMFRGKSMFNPVHSLGRYVRHEAPDREIIMAGDSHVPGMAQWYEGGMLRTYLNGGSAQTQSGYARRYFSLKTIPAWPLVVLDPREHRVTPYWSVSAWLAASGQA